MNKARLPRLCFTAYECTLFGLATIVVILSILYSTIGAEQQPYPGFTQLWMLPQVQARKSCAVHVSVRNFESIPITYRITMTINETPVTTWSSVVLAPQVEWDRLVPISPRATDDIYVEVRLYQLDKPQSVYQKVNLTFHSLGGNGDGKIPLCGAP